ncbi:hypothetical protein PHLCEN_2v12246 [Hermanssonia centrifuga]|uniref:Uncharacterized protein n=1 Tax=Hermanssonia centrifuga TaxID=98765 RepID=A0A2R6NIS8_9APHY|nr:hypothetical protein PHLCEN_2v12246 [Hermanssonia centrifuga]
MSTGPPSTSSAPPNLNGAPSPQPPWDGDRMFNIYIIDYCHKRGYKQTAKTLLEEAGLPDDSHPPINARQGLLFEWWSVFWVLFSAKNSGSGNGNDDAVLYAQHQAQQAAHRQAQAIRASSPSAMNRPVNGINSGGPLTNGAAVPLPQLGQSSLMNGPPTPMAYPGPLPVNGLRPGPTSNGPVIGTPAQQGMQRPPMAPQRAPNGPQFHSPTMAHSPQNPGAGGLSQPTQPSGPLGSSQPLPRTSMLPPNGHQGLPNSGQTGGPQQASQSSYQALAPTSHPNSPAQNPMTAASPSLTARRLPGPSPNDMRQMTESNANDLFRIDSNKLGELKAEVGLRDKDLPSLTYEDKQRILHLARARGLISATPKPGMGQPNATPGPSNLNSSLQQRSQPGGLPQPPQGQQRSVKRSSTSPGDDNESSPPANKRLRPSPPGEHSQPPMAPMVSYTHHPQQGTPGGLNHQSNGIRMMPNMPMGVFPGPPMSSMNNNNHMNMSVGPNMGIPHGMNPSSMNAGMAQVSAGLF